MYIQLDCRLCHLLMICVGAMLCKTLGAAPLVPALVIFGDSTVDVGNNNYLATVVKSDFKPYGRDYPTGPTGRFCDGKVVPDYIAEYIGVPPVLPYLDPNAKGEAILTGINFATSASGWNDDTAVHFNVKGLTTQFEWYRNYQQEVLAVAGQETGKYILSNALYAISTGANDYVNNYYLNAVLMKQYTVDQYQALLLGFARKYIQELYDLGARRIAVLGVPPNGCLPSQITLHSGGTGECVPAFNQAAQNFNQGLDQLIQEMKPSMPGSRLLYVDIYTYLYEASTNPTAYGYVEGRRACCGTGYLEVAILCNEAAPGTCPDASTHVFWDSFHPTSVVYKQIANQLIQNDAPYLLLPIS